MFAFIRKIFPRKENAFYRSQRLACAKDLGLPETATWREIIVANNRLVPFPESLLPDVHSSRRPTTEEIVHAADKALENISPEDLEIALRVETRIMGLRLPARDMMLL